MCKQRISRSDYIDPDDVSGLVDVLIVIISSNNIKDTNGFHSTGVSDCNATDPTGEGGDLCEDDRKIFQLNTWAVT